MKSQSLAVLFLHALPFDSSMWQQQRDVLPCRSYAPTLYAQGDRLEDWAVYALDLVREERIIFVGCSIGGSCALEIAAIAPQRIEALVLIGTKADCTPDPAFLQSALKLMETEDLQAPWKTYWEPLFSAECPQDAKIAAWSAYARREISELKNGATAFHTRKSRSQILATFGGKIVCISGEDDMAPGPDMMQQQAAVAQNGSYHVIPGCGHYVPLEAPDTLNAILKQDLLAHCA